MTATTTTTTTTTAADLLDYGRRKMSGAEASLSAARVELANKATTGSVSDIAYASNVLAATWGTADAWAQVCNLLEYGVLHDEPLETIVREVTTWALGKATSGADDTWSGRTNDLARSRHDGAMSALKRIVDELTFAVEKA